MIPDLGRELGKTVVQRVGQAAGRVQESSPVPADVLERENSYLVVFDAPGATASDIQVRAVDGRVEVRIERFRDHHEGFEMLYPGRGLSLEGRASLPDGARISPDGAEATLRDDGTLAVTVPKAAETTAAE
jgi:HSP20 family molecular chaperone IbpA